MRLLKRKVRKLEGCGKLELERVIGLTSTSASGLSCNPTTGELAYLAGAVVVVYNVKTSCQTRFLMAPKSAKAFTCIAYSGQGGRLLAAGESGHQPGVIVWEVSVGTCVAELRTHKHGVCSVQFSPNGKHLVSVGVHSDGHVCLWDWRSGTLLAKSRASTTSQPACALQFASDGSFFVTGGIKHLKHWVIGLPKARSAGGNGTIGMEGKSVKLGSQKDSSFVAILSAPPAKDATTVTPDFQPLYALSAAGILCLLHCGLAIEKWVDLKVRHGYALAVSEAYVGCACSDGIVRVFMHGSLAYAVTLPRPAPYGYHGLTDASVGATLAVGNRTQPGIRFPDAVACSFLQEGHTLAVIYGDHSLLVWDVQSFSKIGRYRTLLSHNSCIWDVSLLPTPKQAPALQLNNEKDCSLGGAFATCSADGSIRLWNLGSGQEKCSIGLNAASPRPPNIYSKDVLGVLYIENRGDQKDKNATGTIDGESVDTLHGFRTICASPDGQHLAAGDRNGNLRIYDLNTLQLLSFKEAHNGELLSLSFTSNTNDRLVEEPVCMPLLASGGRDRLIHVYDVNRGYDVVETLDDHSASVTTVKFACSGSKLLSCSADKTVVFRNVVASGAGCKSSRYHQELSPRGTFYDIDTDPCDKLAVAVGQDKKLSILNLASGKTVRYLKPEGDVGEPFKVRLDPSGMYVICSHSDRILRVYDFLNGELLAYASGHAEIVTGMVFLPDCRRLVSVSGDSCIFIWRLPLNMSRSMRKRCIANAESRPPPRCLKSAPTLSPRHLDRTISTPRRVDQAIPFDPLDVKAKDSCQNDQKDSSVQIKHGQVITLSASVHDSSYKAVDRPHTEPAESKKRSGRDGYRAVSDVRREAVLPVDSSNIRSYPAEDLGTNLQKNVLESRAFQPEGSPLLSAQDDLRRESHWKTVHTVFFGENDYSHDEPVSKAGPEVTETCENDRRNRAGNGAVSSKKMNAPFNGLEEKIPQKSSLSTEKNLQATLDPEDEDRIVTDLPDAGEVSEAQKSLFALEKTKSIDEEGEKHERACEEIKSSRERIDVSSAGGETLENCCSYDKETLDCHAQPIQAERTPEQDLKADGEFKRILTLEKTKISIDTELMKVNDDGDEDCDFQTRKDLLNGRFQKIASNRKEEDLDNSSFSTHCFARSNLSHPQSLWFDTSLKTEVEIAGTETQALLQDEDLENNPGRLLAAERERLKLRERQNKMAIEVQRMRERLVNLGIAVAEIAHDGECTERKWEGEDKFSGYAFPAESPNKRSAFAAHDAAEFQDSCLPNPPSEAPGSTQHGAKSVSSFCLQDRIVDGTESLCLGVVSKKNGIALSAGESYNLDGAAPCMMGTPRTPRTPSGSHNLRNLDGRKIDLWQIKAREDPEGRNRLNVEEEKEEEISMAAQPTSVKQDEKPADKQGSGVEDPSICRLIKIPSKAEVGRVLANRGERNAAERGLISQEHSPCTRAAGPHAKSHESELTRRKEYEIVANHKDALSSIATVSPTFGRALKSRETVMPFFEEGNHNVEQRLDGRHSNTKPKADSHASIPPSCTFPACKDSLSSTRFFEASNCERREMLHEHEETDFQGDSQLIRTQRLFERCKSVNMNEFLGEIPGVEVQDRPPCSSLGPAGEEPCISSPLLPRPVEDYQKSLYDLMEAADRASSLFGEVRSFCRRTTSTPSEAPCTPSTSVSLDILSLSSTYQRLLPGTLQTVQRLADEAAACGLPCNRAVITVDNDSLNSFSPSIDLLNSSATGSSMFQSRPGTGASSSLASVDVEGFISRFSETLASQVLALVHKALPGKQS